MFPFLNETVELEVDVQNLSNTEKSEIHLAFFDSEDTFPNDPIKTYSTAVTSQNAQRIQIQDIEPGEYIIAIYQDLDGNEELNKNWIGIPKEPYGFSNNIKPGITGLPLNKSFVHVPCQSHISIKLNH